MDTLININQADLERFAEVIAVRTAERVLGDQVLSKREMLERYGTEFGDALKAGRIQPVRKGNGVNGKQGFLVSAFLALRACDIREARLQIDSIR